MKHPFRLLLLCIVCLLFNLTVVSQQSAQEFYQRGLEQLKNSKYDLAIASFTEAIRINPEYTDAYFKRAKARQNNQRDLRGAMEDIEKAIELNPSFGETYYERALIRNYQFTKQADKSRLIPQEEITAISNKLLGDLDLAINYGFKTKDAYLMRAEVKCRNLGKCAEAILDYDAAIMLSPDAVGIYINRANAKRQINDLSGAISDLSEIVTRYNLKQNLSTPKQDGNVEPLNGQGIDRTAVSLALTNLGGLLRQKGNNEQALYAYNQAIAISPESPFGYDARGQYNLAFGNLDEAIADFSKAIEISGQSASSYINRGIAFYLQGKQAEAQKDFDKAIEIAPHLKDRIASMVERAKTARVK